LILSRGFSGKVYITTVGKIRLRHDREVTSYSSSIMLTRFIRPRVRAQYSRRESVDLAIRSKA
jgi:hypothetical protein